MPLRELGSSFPKCRLRNRSLNFVSMNFQHSLAAMKRTCLWYPLWAPRSDIQVLYLSNSPWNAYTNYSFLQSTFYPSQLDMIFDNSFQQLTYINASGDPEWPACLACALIHGSVKKMGLNETAQCQGCWSRHCWNGVNTNKTTAEVTPFEPELLMIPGLNWSYWNS